MIFILRLWPDADTLGFRLGDPVKIQIVPVERGQDNATHLNLLTNYEEVAGITPTR